MKTMKSVFFGTLTMVSFFIFNSCTEEPVESTNTNIVDTLAPAAVRTVNYTVLVVAAEASGTTKSAQAVAGANAATVTVAVGGSVNTVTTGASGQATFVGLTAGTVAVTVSLADHTTCNYLVDLTLKEDEEGEIDNDNTRTAATKVILLPTTGTGMITLSGIVEAQLDYAVDFPSWITSEFDYQLSTKLEPAPAGTVVAVEIDYSDLDEYVSMQSHGEVLEVTYEGLVLTTTTDASGAYSIQVPSSTYGVSLNITVADFAYNAVYSSQRRDADNILERRDINGVSVPYISDATQRVIYYEVSTGFSAYTGQNQIIDIDYGTTPSTQITDDDAYYGI